MAKEQTEKSRFCTKYSPTNKFITNSQYIAEILMERRARLNKEVLPIKYWSTKQWKGQFMKEMLLANKLLKQYNVFTILAAIQSKDGQYILSLNNNKLPKLLIKYKTDKEFVKLEKQEENTTKLTQQKTFQRKTRNILEELDV